METLTMSESSSEVAIAERLDYNIKWIVRNGAGIQVMETLAVGAFLTAYVLQMGASNFVIGLLAAVPHLSQLAQIPAMYAIDKVGSRRKLYTWSGWVARPMILLIGFSAFLSPTVALPAIVGCFIIRYIAGAFLSCAWNSWMRDLVPEEVMGQVFSKRQKFMIGISMLLTLLAAGFVEAWGRWSGFPQLSGYTVIYTLAFFGGAYAVWSATHLDEPPTEPQESVQGLLQRLLEPFSDNNYRRLIIFLGSWNFAINLAAPFFTVHMLKQLGLNLFMVMALATLSQFSAYMMVSQWGVLADRFSNKSVLSVCAPLFVFCIFAWTFTSMPEPHAFTLPLLIFIHMATGVASAGVGLASGNIALKLAPRGKATAYLATNSMVNAVLAGTASMLGGLTADIFSVRQLSIIIRWFDPGGSTDFNAFSLSYWDFYFLLATIIGLYALHRLSSVTETGDVEESVVIDTILNNTKQSLRSLSTISGLRAASDFPISAIRNLRGRKGRMPGD